MNNETIQQQQAMEMPIRPITLSPRERQIIALLADGFNSGEIATELHISIKTVDAHRHNMLKKTGCKNSAHLVAFSIQNGIIE